MCICLSFGKQHGRFSIKSATYDVHTTLCVKDSERQLLLACKRVSYMFTCKFGPTLCVQNGIQGCDECVYRHTLPTHHERRHVNNWSRTHVQMYGRGYVEGGGWEVPGKGEVLRKESPSIYRLAFSSLKYTLDRGYVAEHKCLKEIPYKHLSNLRDIQ